MIGRSFTFILKLVSKVLILTMLNLGVTMATYACPIELPAPVNHAMEEMPCAEIDYDKPVHCAIHLGHDELALQHLHVPLVLTLPTMIHIIPLAAVTDTVSPSSLDWLTLMDADNTPAYMRTQRMRI